MVGDRAAVHKDTPGRPTALFHSARAEICPIRRWLAPRACPGSPQISQMPQIDLSMARVVQDRQTYLIIGCAMEVHRQLGSRFLGAGISRGVGTRIRREVCSICSRSGAEGIVQRSAAGCEISCRFHLFLWRSIGRAQSDRSLVGAGRLASPRRVRGPIGEICEICGPWVTRHRRPAAATLPRSARSRPW